jgi:hypothetical protein
MWAYGKNDSAIISENSSVFNSSLRSSSPSSKSDDKKDMPDLDEKTTDLDKRS